MEYNVWKAREKYRHVEIIKLYTREYWKDIFVGYAHGCTVVTQPEQRAESIFVKYLHLLPIQEYYTSDKISCGTVMNEINSLGMSFLQWLNFLGGMQLSNSWFAWRMYIVMSKMLE